MYFTRIRLNTHLNIHKLITTLQENKYYEHQTLWRLFDEDPNAKRDFLYRQAVEQGQIKYYILSKRKPIDKTGIWYVEGPKTYNPILKIDQKLFFMLKANPVVTVSSKTGQKQRHDIVMHEKQTIGYSKIPINKRVPLQKLIQNKCIKWLHRKAKSNGFEFKDSEVLADGYQQHKIQKIKPKNNIHYSTVDFQGILTVIDPELFQHALIKGIGKSKAFGCGLILIKKV